ncbi:ATP-binding protein [Rhizobium beringeri]
MEPDRNWRGSDSSQRVPDGRGLGLAIVKTIVDAHHGELFIDTDCGRGFKVTIRLLSTPPGVRGI